jgi:hypothetical protein
VAHTLAPVSEGNDKGFEGSSPDLAERLHGGLTRGTILLVDSGDQRPDCGGADLAERPCGLLAHTVVGGVESPDERLDGGSTNLDAFVPVASRGPICWSDPSPARLPTKPAERLGGGVAHIPIPV